MKIEDYIRTRLTQKLTEDTTEQQMIDIAFDLIHELKEHNMSQVAAVRLIVKVIRSHSLHLGNLLLVLSKLSQKD
jgi:hypothetical protein